MNKDVVLLLVCPVCSSAELRLQAFAVEQDEVREGTITCSSCHTWYRIENGVLDFLPLSLRRYDRYASFSTKYSLPPVSGPDSQRIGQKAGQIDFFSATDDYERRVVNNPYYQALDRVAFLDWLERNQASIKGIALDVGCGTGRQSIPLAQRGLRAVGIDISEEMLVLAKRKVDAEGLSQQVDFIVGDAENLPVKDGAFGATVFYGVLHHLSAPQAAIGNAARKLVQGGLFYSLDPHKSPVRFAFDLLMRAWKLYDEEASDDPLLTSDKLVQWLSEAGIGCAVKLSTYLPPHVFQFIDLSAGTKLLKASDALLGSAPGLRGMAGVIISEGVKR